MLKRARDEGRKALVLADVAAHGESRSRDVVPWLKGKAGDFEFERLLRTLAAEGRIRVESRILQRTFPHGDGRRVLRIKIYSYSAAEG